MNSQEINDALASNYLLVSMSIRTWSGKVSDKKVASEVINAKSAVKDSGAFVKNLLASADAELKEVQAAANALRSFLYNNTLPWTLTSDGAKRGERIVATAKSLEFLRDVAEHKRHYDDAVVQLQNVWDERVAQAQTNLGGMANAKDYPLRDELPDLFSVSVELNPIPAVTDFNRLNVPAQLQSALAKRMSQQMEAQMKNAMDNLRERLLEELGRMATQLGKVGRGEKTKLFETLTTNCQSLVGLARSMNLSGSTRLTELADKIEAQLLAHPVEVYKGDVGRAAATAAQAAELLKEAQELDVWY